MTTGTIRLFVESDLFPGADVTATGLQAHYLGAVMRRSAGDPVILFNGRDGEWLARITHLRRDSARFEPEHQTRTQTPLPEKVLAFAPLKRDATDLVVQKATELGVTAIHPVLTARSNTQRVNLERFRAITIEAAEQCERLDLPLLHPPVQLYQFLAAWPAEKPLAACIERLDQPESDQPGSAGAKPPAIIDAAGLIVGPEGGFTVQELEVLRRHPFLMPVSLGSLILRAETAAIAGLALLHRS